MGYRSNNYAKNTSQTVALFSQLLDSSHGRNRTSNLGRDEHHMKVWEIYNGLATIHFAGLLLYRD
jgi:hypothetical protein